MKQIIISLCILLTLFTLPTTAVVAAAPCETNPDICKKPGNPHCEGNDLYQSLGDGYCDPGHNNADKADGCVRAWTVLPNQAGCYQGKPGEKGNFTGIFGSIKPPKELEPLMRQGGNSGAGAIAAFISNGIALIYWIAGIIFLFMIIQGGIQWMMSGGDKESISKARARLTHAAIGMGILAVAFFAANFIGKILGFKIF